MADESETGREIVPDDKHTELILPGEMVRRGLELAIRIEKKWDIQQFSSEIEGEYLVRCQVAIMEWYRDDDGSLKLRDTDEPTPVSSLYLNLSVDKGGVWFSCPREKFNLFGMENNDDHFRFLTAFGNLKPFYVPFTSLGLYYMLISPVKDSYKPPLSHLSNGDMKDLFIKMGPGGRHPGFWGPIIKKANPLFALDRDCVETVILYASMLADPNLSKNLVAKNPPLKLSMVVIDPNGEKDLVSSHALYHEILEAKDPNVGPLIYVSVAELFKDIPVNPAQENNWRQWQNNYEGRYIKARGRFESLSFFRKSGKLFIIADLQPIEMQAGNQPKKVALMIHGVRKMSLGEEEGSFLLDGKKWVYLGETYSFMASVSKYALFDDDLRNSDFNDAVVVNVRLQDIING